MAARRRAAGVSSLVVSLAAWLRFFKQRWKEDGGGETSQTGRMTHHQADWTPVHPVSRCASFPPSEC